MGDRSRRGAAEYGQRRRFLRQTDEAGGRQFARLRGAFLRPSPATEPPTPSRFVDVPAGWPQRNSRQNGLCQRKPSQGTVQPNAGTNNLPQNSDDGQAERRRPRIQTEHSKGSGEFTHG